MLITNSASHSKGEVLPGEAISSKYVTIILLFVLFVIFCVLHLRNFNCANAFMVCLYFSLLIKCFDKKSLSPIKKNKHKLIIL